MNPEMRRKLDELAMLIADEALQKGKVVQERIDALKACTTYYAMVSKGKKPPEEPDGKDFQAFGRALGIEDPDGAVRAARRRGPGTRPS